MTVFRHKLESRLTTFRICISDDKLRMLVDVCRHIPMPRSNSMIGLDDSIDGHIELAATVMVFTHGFANFDSYVAHQL